MTFSDQCTTGNLSLAAVLDVNVVRSWWDECFLYLPSNCGRISAFLKNFFIEATQEEKKTHRYLASYLKDLLAFLISLGIYLFRLWRMMGNASALRFREPLQINPLMVNVTRSYRNTNRNCPALAGQTQKSEPKRKWLRLVWGRGGLCLIKSHLLLHWIIKA